jgi:hypothetical protein
MNVYLFVKPLLTLSNDKKKHSEFFFLIFISVNPFYVQKKKKTKSYNCTMECHSVKKTT